MTLSPLRQGLSRCFTEEQLDRIRRTRVLIAGCGGLGSNMAQMLVRSGFQNLTLIDFDVVDNSNLNRQFFFPDQLGKAKTQALAENLLRLEPDLELRLLPCRLTGAETAALAEKCDILAEAFDGPESKAAFVRAAAATGKPVVCAAGLAGYGNTDQIRVRKVGSRIFAVGDGYTSIENSPPLAPRVMVAAAKEADLVLQLTLEGSAHAG